MTLPWKCADCKSDQECQCPQLSGVEGNEAQAQWEQERAEWYAEALSRRLLRVLESG